MRLICLVSRVPAEIIAQGPVAEEAYQEALKYGKVEVYRGCIKIIGQDRTGKTCLRRSLCGLPFKSKQESTVGVEVFLCTPVTKNEIVSWDINKNKDIISDDDVALITAKNIQLQVSLQ